MLRFCFKTVPLPLMILLSVTVASCLKSRQPKAPAAESAPAGSSRLIARGGDEPDIEIAADHQLAKTIHKDSEGRRPLEHIQTSAGVVTVQRTFNDQGKLLKEEAFLDGKPVPVPRP